MICTKIFTIIKIPSILEFNLLTEQRPWPLKSWRMTNSLSLMQHSIWYESVCRIGQRLENCATQSFQNVFQNKWNKKFKKSHYSILYWSKFTHNMLCSLHSLKCLRLDWEGGTRREETLRGRYKKLISRWNNSLTQQPTHRDWV